ncbi:MAG: hypothetical protein MK105_19810 [Crocinitomicaceae bacterium]|nr:hypothetical protein [Crocinitomicaceae bacterium]
MSFSKCTCVDECQNTPERIVEVLINDLPLPNIFNIEDCFPPVNRPSGFGFGIAPENTPFDQIFTCDINDFSKWYVRLTVSGKCESFETYDDFVVDYTIGGCGSTRDMSVIYRGEERVDGDVLYPASTLLCVPVWAPEETYGKVKMTFNLVVRSTAIPENLCESISCFEGSTNYVVWETDWENDIVPRAMRFETCSDYFDASGAIEINDYEELPIYYIGWRDEDLDLVDGEFYADPVSGILNGVNIYRE